MLKKLFLAPLVSPKIDPIFWSQTFPPSFTWRSVHGVPCCQKREGCLGMCYLANQTMPRVYGEKRQAASHKIHVSCLSRFPGSTTQPSAMRPSLLILPLVLLLLSVSAWDQLSLSAQQPYLPSKPVGPVFASMCIGTSDDLVRRCLIAVARWRHVVKENSPPLIYYIRDNFPAYGVDYLKSVPNVHVVVLDELPWPASETYPIAPKRFYSFYKLAAFNLYGYRVLWFDSDAYLLQDPSHLFDYLPKNATGEEVVAWRAPAKLHEKDYFNSGVMVFKPNRKTTQRILQAWSTGDFRMHGKHGGKVEDHITEQEVLFSVFHYDNVVPLPNCINFRRQKAYSKVNQLCDLDEIVTLHDSKAFSNVTEEFCRYWSNVIETRESDPLLCNADVLYVGAPSFSLEWCADYFSPPSMSRMCRSPSPNPPPSFK